MNASPNPVEDGPLAAAARSGSLDALAELYHRHADTVHTVAYRLTASEDDAADIVQDVFVGLPRALGRYDERGSFPAWIRQVAARTSLMRLRGARRRGEHPLSELTEEAAAASSTAPLDRIAVLRALDALPDGYRTVFVLREIEGYTHAEIAGMIGISSGNAATRLSRAWTMLRKELNK